MVKSERMNDNLKTVLKRLLPVALAAWLPLAAAGADDWVSVKIPVEEGLSGISFLNKDSGLVITNWGRYLLTTDGCRSWRTFVLKEGAAFEDVHYLNSRRAFICGRGGMLFRTVDGCATWQNQSLPDTLPWLTDVEMFDDQTGMVIGMTRRAESPFEGLALRTTDGGDTWHPLVSLGLGYAELCHRPSEPVYLLSFGKVSISFDKGKTWESVPTVQGEPCRAMAMHGLAGVIAGPGGMRAYTLDGARTWQLAKSQPDRVFIAAVIVSDTVGYLGGMGGVMMYTEDGGRTWKDEKIPEAFDIYDLALVADRLYAVGSDGHMIYKKVK
jgi:photosystem II stability/assembly factor-like uncharacterized protein